MIHRFALVGALALAAELSGVAPSLTTDLDGDGTAETVTAAPAKGSVRLRVRNAAGAKLADAKAPAPDADVVPVALTSGPLGSAGALIEVAATTDAMECRTVWRYRGGELTKLPIRDASGRALPDCAPPAGWVSRWESEGAGRPAAWARGRDETVAAGALRTRESYAFAGFSLDFDPARSDVQIEGIPIPSWYAATLYPRAALETLYGRFRLGDMRREPTLRIDTDRRRGIFALRLTGPKGELVAPVEAYAASLGTATLSARSADATAHVAIRLAGDGTVPYEVRVEGLGADWDGTYSPAGAWRGGVRQVFLDAANEIASEHLAGVWSDARGRTETFAIEGEPPYRLRIDGATYAVDADGAAPPFDLLLLPPDNAGRAWGIVLKGANALERFPVACAGGSARPPCRAEGESETLRRFGARVNVR